MKKTKDETIKYFMNMYRKNGLNISKEELIKAYDEIKEKEDELNAYMKSRGF